MRSAESKRRARAEISYGYVRDLLAKTFHRPRSSFTMESILVWQAKLRVKRLIWQTKRQSRAS